MGANRVSAATAAAKLPQRIDCGPSAGPDDRRQAQAGRPHAVRAGRLGRVAFRGGGEGGRRQQGRGVPALCRRAVATARRPRGPGRPHARRRRPIEEALVAYACEVFSYFASGNGYANLRVHIDGAQYPDVLKQYRIRVVEPQIEQAVAVLERARDDGQIDPETSCTAVIEALGGAVMVHALASVPTHGRRRCAQCRHGASADRLRPADPLWTVRRADRVKSSATRRRRRPAASR